MKRSCFTLIELLVVISIIAILAGLLLPALNHARDLAYGTACMNNQKQIGLSMMSYVSDSHEYFPPYLDGTWNWGYGLSKDRYITNNKVYFCPTSGNYITYPHSKVGDTNSCASRPADAYRYQYITYGYNYLFLGSNYGRWSSATGTLLPTAKLPQVKRPSSKIMAADSINPSALAGTFLIGADYISTANVIIHDRHSKGANIIWSDGHVTSERDAKMRLQNAALTGNRYFNHTLDL